jgi:hypothetical protein
MRLIEPFEFESPKPDRARLLIALVLWLNVIISWALLKDARNGGGGLSEPALMCSAPNIAALITLLRGKGLDGAKLAQVVAWGFVVVGTIFWTFGMAFSYGAHASDRFAGSAFIGILLALQMTIPAAIRWGRSDLTLFESFAQHMRIFFVLVPMLVLGFLFS